MIAVEPRQDKIVVHYEPTPGDNHYYHVRPKEGKTKLFIGEKEAVITDFKEKDIVVLGIDKAKTIVELRLFKAGATKSDKTEAIALFLSKGVAARGIGLAASDPKDKEKKGPSETFTVSLKAGTSYLITLSSKKFDPFLRVENLKGELIASDHDSGGAGKSQLVYEPKEDMTVRLIATSFDGAGVGAGVVSVREKK